MHVERETHSTQPPVDRGYATDGSGGAQACLSRANVSEASGCTNASISGAYGLTATGTLFGPNSTSGGIALVGLLGLRRARPADRNANRQHRRHHRTFHA